MDEQMIDRFAAERCARADRRPETFDFLDFKHSRVRAGTCDSSSRWGLFDKSGKVVGGR